MNGIIVGVNISHVILQEAGLILSCFNFNWSLILSCDIFLLQLGFLWQVIPSDWFVPEI